MSGESTWRELEQKISEAVKPAKRPVAVSFLDAEPTDTKKFAGTEPSGCSFWRLAAGGQTFYTVPENHFNCAVGAYTHNIALSPEREKETEQTLKLMFDLGYVKPEQKEQAAKVAKEEKKEQAKAAAKTAKAEGKPPPAPTTLSNALKQRLEMWLVAATRDAIAGEPQLVNSPLFEILAKVADRARTTGMRPTSPIFWSTSFFVMP